MCVKLASLDIEIRLVYCANCIVIYLHLLLHLSLEGICCKQASPVKKLQSTFLLPFLYCEYLLDISDYFYDSLFKISKAIASSTITTAMLLKN